MNTRPLLLSLLALCLGLSRPLLAADAPKPGYKVVLDVVMDEKGVAESAQVVATDDLSGEQILGQIAMNLAKGLKQPPQQKDGKPVKFTVRVPFDFPLEGDEGVEANLAPKPSLHGKNVVQPAYPAALAAKGEMGGAVIELVVNTDGMVKTATLLRASHPEFGESALAAVKQWTFRPALKDGVPLESRSRVAIAFTIDDRDVDWKWRIPPRPSLGGFKVIHRTTPLPAPAGAPAPAPAPAPVVTPAPGK